eukprot:5787394-Pleurochrysis_carterae.AAC.5
MRWCVRAHTERARLVCTMHAVFANIAVSSIALDFLISSTSLSSSRPRLFPHLVHVSFKQLRELALDRACVPARALDRLWPRTWTPRRSRRSRSQSRSSHFRRAHG